LSLGVNEPEGRTDLVTLCKVSKVQINAKRAQEKLEVRIGQFEDEPRGQRKISLAGLSKWIIAETVPTRLLFERTRGKAR
jgi:hypothetical protein